MACVAAMAQNSNPHMITTHPADAVENCENCRPRPASPRPASRRAVRNERPHHEARRHSTSDNDATRARGRLRPRDRRNRRRPAATGPCRVGSDRLPLRRGLRRDRHLRRRALPRSTGTRRPSTGASTASSSCWARCSACNFLHLAGAHRFDQFGDLGRRHRPCPARLAADAGHALPRHLPDRADHGHQWTVDRPMVLGRRRAARDEPRRAATTRCKIWSRAGRLGEVRGHRRRRTGVATPAAQHERDPGRPAHLRRLRRRRGLTCRGGAWDMPSWVRSTIWCATCASMASTPSSWRCRSTSEHLLVETLNKLSLLPVDVRLCPGEFAHAARRPSGEPHRRSHLPERHRPAAARLAVDRQVGRGPAPERIDPGADLAAHAGDRAAHPAGQSAGRCSSGRSATASTTS